MWSDRCNLFVHDEHQYKNKIKVIRKRFRFTQRVAKLLLSDWLRDFLDYEWGTKDGGLCAIRDVTFV